MKQVVLWLRIIRPQTLFASLCPVLVGLMVAHTLIDCSSSFAYLTAFLTATCALALQVLSNLINDYYDYKRGTDKQGRVGFKRALAEGTVTVRAMRWACLICLAISLVLGAVLCLIGGWVIVAIGITAILFAWLYTATPYSLSYLGIADIFVFLYYGVVATWGTVWLQYRAAGLTLDLSQMQPVYAGAVCGLISMCVLFINNIRDMDDDRLVGKRTIPVRFGGTAALGILGIIVMLMPLFAWLAFGLSWARRSHHPRRTPVLQRLESPRCTVQPLPPPGRPRQPPICRPRLDEHLSPKKACQSRKSVVRWTRNPSKYQHKSKTLVTRHQDYVICYKTKISKVTSG